MAKKRRGANRPVAVSPEKIQFRPGSLADPLTLHLLKTQQRVGAYLRGLIAADLGVEAPAMNGQVKNLKRGAAT